MRLAYSSKGSLLCSYLCSLSPLFSFERDFQALRLEIWGDWLMENDDDKKRRLSTIESESESENV